MDAIAESHHAGAALEALMSRAAGLIGEHGAHAARTVVLLPFVHLLQPMREAWARIAPDGFAPRFETTATLSSAAMFVPGADDFTGDLARDLLLAHSLVERAGLGAHARLLAPRLVDAARQLAPAVSSVMPAERKSWAARARHAAGFDAPMLTHEAAIATIAIEWVAASSFASDALLQDAFARDIDLLVVVQGLRREPLAETLLSQLCGRAEALSLPPPAAFGAIALHEATDPADEAERAAACVTRHVRDQRTPIALVAIDRILTRRIRAILEQAGAAIRDETGWTLSTTRAAAHVMLALRACAWNAGTDAVIDWLKNSPSHPEASVLAIERRTRRAGIREWRSLRAGDLGDGQLVLLEKVNAWRDGMQAVRALPQWLESLRDLLQASGQWTSLDPDAAGAQVLSALRLHEFDRVEFEAFAPARRRMTLAEFTAWAGDILESQTFAPPSAADADVVILPLHQAVGRSFGALVIPGCDEARLPASPDPAGMWSESQRAALGLPTRAVLEAETREAWRRALATPMCDVLWRAADEKGEPVLASVLVRQLELEGVAREATDTRDVRNVEAAPVAPPGPAAAMLPVEKLSASAYEDLRRCPYRFFALRQLGLQEPDEIDVDLDKRDFGNWLHKVLSAFHGELSRSGDVDIEQKGRMLDEAAQAVTRDMRLDEGEFLPFRAAWPQVRRGYLQWLMDHEAEEGAVFQESESEHERRLGPLTLFGRIDRVDRLRGGVRMVMDYKTEGAQTTQERVKQPGEDTQLAFYAALLEDDDLRAAYINIGERGETRAFEQKDVITARELLLAGIANDAQRIAEGATMPALGEGKACEYCAARGLCRKDFWA